MLNNKLLILIRDTKRLFRRLRPQLGAAAAGLVAARDEDGGSGRTLRAPSYPLYVTESCMYLIALFDR